MSRKHLPDGIQVRWLGHATFDVVGPAGQKFLFDPFVVQNPAFPKELGAQITAPGAYDALLIPDQAVTTQQSDEIAYVVAANGEVQQRKVMLGPRFGDLRVVRSGLKETDTVVIDGVQRAKAGARVTPKAGRITPPNPDSMPNPVDTSPPPASASFPDQPR